MSSVTYGENLCRPQDHPNRELTSIPGNGILLMMLPPTGPHSMDTLPPPIGATAPGAAPTPKWPKIIGIIAIIFGSGGLLSGVIGPLSMLMVRTQMEGFVKQGADQTKVDDYLARLAQITYSSAIANALIGIILLTGGILILRHRRTGSPTLQTWSFLKIVVGGLFLFKSVSLSRLQMEIMMSSNAMGGAGSAEAQMIGSITSYAVWAGMAFGFLWLAALPVFVLIWFNRAKVKQDIRAW